MGAIKVRTNAETDNSARWFRRTRVSRYREITTKTTSYYSIQARRFDSTGMPLGSQFQVNTYTTRFQTYPAVASDAAGNFVVVWESEESNDSIQGQRYDSTGMPQGSRSGINSRRACGGTPKGDPDKVLKRKDCPAPLACP